VVARAALAITAAIQDLAYVIDPSLDIRIELASGTEGSLSLNAILRNLKDHKGQSLTLGAVAIVIMSWLGTHALDYGFEKAADLITDADHEAFTPAQHKELTDIVTKAVEGQVAHQHVQRFYREIERDPAIKGVGGSTVPGQRPAVIVHRAEFPERAGRMAPVEQTIHRRSSVERVRVLLISPVLLPGNRRWKLRSAQGEFGAAIKDTEFINRVLTGTTSIRMKAGIEMDVELETAEEFRHGVWEVTERNVTHVDNLIEPPSQGDLGLLEGYGQEPDHDDD
jgi:hypothetical protein